MGDLAQRSIAYLGRHHVIQCRKTSSSLIPTSFHDSSGDMSGLVGYGSSDDEAEPLRVRFEFIIQSTFVDFASSSLPPLPPFWPTIALDQTVCAISLSFVPFSAPYRFGVADLLQMDLK